VGYAAAHLAEALRYKPEGRGSIPDRVSGIFQSFPIVTLGLTQPLTEMSARYISWGVKEVGA